MPTPGYKEHTRALACGLNLDQPDVTTPEGLLPGRGFGVSKTQILEAINWGTFYGGHESLNLVDEVAGDVLDSWPA